MAHSANHPELRVFPGKERGALEAGDICNGPPEGSQQQTRRGEHTSRTGAPEEHRPGSITGHDAWWMRRDLEGRKQMRVQAGRLLEEVGEKTED